MVHRCLAMITHTMGSLTQEDKTVTHIPMVRIVAYMIIHNSGQMHFAATVEVEPVLSTTTCNGMAQDHRANHGNLPRHLKESMEALALQPQVDHLNRGLLVVALEELLREKPLLLEDKVVSTEEAALFMEAAVLFMEVAIAEEDLSILVEVDQAVAGALEVEAGVLVVPHIPEVPHILADHQDGQVVVLLVVAAQLLEEVELLLLEVVDLQSLEVVVVFTVEAELVGTGNLVAQAHQAAPLLTAPHQAVPQALLHTAAGAASIFMKSVKVLCLFA